VIRGRVRVRVRFEACVNARGASHQMGDDSIVGAESVLGWGVKSSREGLS